MTYLTAYKLTLILLLINLPLQLIAQTNETGIIKGKITDAKSDTELIGANAFIEFDSEYVGTQSDLNGNFEFEIPIGKHLLKISYIGYEDITKEVTVKSNETLEYELSITPIDTSCPWLSSIPYAELQGFWKPEYFKGNNKTNQSKRKDKAGVYFYFSNDSLPGKLSWNDGCYNEGNIPPRDEVAATYFRHIGNGIIEVESRGLKLVTGLPPKCSILNEELVAFMRNIDKKKIKTSVTDNGQLLSLTMGDERIMLRKIHNYTLPGFNTELLGTWEPVNGKLKRKKIRKFVYNAEVVFDVKNLEEKIGSVKYEDAECDKDRVNLTFRYFDEDFISFQYYSWNSKDKICNRKFLLGSLLGELYKYGCYFKFNETKDTVTLQYGKNYLVLKRKD